MRLGYAIDATDRITHVSGAWAAFAVENGAPGLVDGVVGERLWTFIDGVQTRAVYRLLLTRVRGGRLVQFGFDCPSPTRQRRLLMVMTATAHGGVRFETALLSEGLRDKVRPPAGLLVLHVCSWCKRVRVSESWCEPEYAVEYLEVFGSARDIELSHGICPACGVALELASEANP